MGRKAGYTASGKEGVHLHPNTVEHNRPTRGWSDTFRREWGPECGTWIPFALGIVSLQSSTSSFNTVVAGLREMHHDASWRRCLNDQVMRTARLLDRYAHHLDLLPRLVILIHLDVLNVVDDVQTAYCSAKDPARQRRRTRASPTPTCACRSTTDMARS